MGSPENCPTTDKLHLMSGGDLPPREFETVCAHVEGCARCQARLGAHARQDDPFVRSISAIRGADLDSASREIDSQPPVPPGPDKIFPGGNNPVPVLRPPCTLGPYEVEAPLGQGGMGEVYRARHSRLERPVALKVIRHHRQADPAIHERFLREMALLGTLDHPNLVRAHDAWEAEGCLYLVMELIEGQPLGEAFAPGNARVAGDAAAIFRGVCQGLEYLHSHGILHGDLKPANVMVLPDAGVKVIDIGLARRMLQEQPGPGGTFGTRDWMAPEVESRSGPVDQRADIWALGRLLAHMLDRMSPADPDRFQRGLSARLRALAGRLSAPSPDARPGNIGEVLRELDSAERKTHRLPLRRALALGASVLAAAAVWMILPPAGSQPGADAGNGGKTGRSIGAGAGRPVASHPMRLVTIPAGEFVMGGVEGDPMAAPDEWPTRSVRFSRPFGMGATEVTVAQFREFVEDAGYTTEPEVAGKGGWRVGFATSKGVYSSEASWRFPGYGLAEDLPVTTVTYRDAMAFCRWLSQRDKKVYRLPTEAEWEYACRAGGRTVFPYPEDQRDEHSWSSYNTPIWLTPRPVGTLQPNAWGLHDMMGNVREWCLDWYDARAYDTPHDQAPAGPEAGQLRVIRGSCFMDKARLMRSATRGYHEPDEAFNNQGFRVVRVDE